ncbi:hypothetical protein [Croceimicrobium sp.]|uniref:hypothetical protein n=1 Tax=Croceimicrobium sp. TaxID=2828340 RepID=UPI003BABD5E7
MNQKLKSKIRKRITSEYQESKVGRIHYNEIHIQENGPIENSGKYQAVVIPFDFHHIQERDNGGEFFQKGARMELRITLSIPQTIAQFNDPDLFQEIERELTKTTTLN